MDNIDAQVEIKSCTLLPIIVLLLSSLYHFEKVTNRAARCARHYLVHNLGDMACIGTWQKTHIVLYDECGII